MRGKPTRAPSSAARQTPVAPARPFRWRVAGAVAVVLAGVAVWWAYRPPAPPPPPHPADIRDPEVREAVRAAREGVSTAADSAAAWGHYGMVLMVHDFDAEAEECLAQAERLSPTDPRWPYGRALLAVRRGNPDDAPGHFRRVIDSGDAEYRTPARFGLAEFQLERGELTTAGELFRQELGAEPGHPRANFGLGRVAVAAAEDAAAARHLTAAREHPACRKQATALLAALARRRGDAAAATSLEAEAQDADVANWPDPFVRELLKRSVGADGRRRRIEALERQGQLAEARAEYRRLFAVERTAKMLTRAALNEARLDDLPQAVALAREAVGLDGQDAEARYALALVLLLKWERAPATVNAGEIGREIVAEARQAVALKPDHARAYLVWGKALKLAGDPLAAREPIRAGLVARPDDVELLIGMGQVLAATGDVPGARANFEAAKRLKPADLRAARELERLGRK